MGRKRRRLCSNIVKINEAVDNGSGLYEKIINVLGTLNKSSGLVIGSNAVLRELEKKSLAVVLLILSKASSPLYHSLHLWCRSTGVLFLPLRETDRHLLSDKIQYSVTYGIKEVALSEHPILFQQTKEVVSKRKPCTFSNQKKQQEIPALNKIDKVENPLANVVEVNFLCHKRHDTLKKKEAINPFGDEAEDFISLKEYFADEKEYASNEKEYTSNEMDFPKYPSIDWNKISFNIK